MKASLPQGKNHLISTSSGPGIHAPEPVSPHLENWKSKGQTVPGPQKLKNIEPTGNERCVDPGSGPNLF